MRHSSLSNTEYMESRQNHQGREIAANPNLYEDCKYSSILFKQNASNSVCIDIEALEEMRLKIKMTLS